MGPTGAQALFSLSNHLVLSDTHDPFQGKGFEQTKALANSSCEQKQTKGRNMSVKVQGC